MKKVLLVMTVVALTIFVASTSFAGSLPSSKASCALGDLVDLGIASESLSSNDTGFVKVMQAYIKTPNQKDLSFDVALQCGLITDTTVRSKGGEKDSAQAVSSISVRVKVTNMDTGEVRYAEPSEEGTMDDGTPMGVTYCSRLQQLDAKFAGLNCTADLTTGVVTCTDPEELRLLLQTLNANAFNFMLADVEPGIQHIEVEARAQTATNTELSGTGLGEADAEAFVGLGSMDISTVRMIKDADVGPIVELD